MRSVKKRTGNVNMGNGVTDLDLLISKGLIGERDAEELETLSEKSGKRLRDIIISKGLITEESLLEIEAAQLEYEYMDSLYEKDVSEEFLDAIPLDYARRYSVIAIKENGDIKLVTSSEESLDFLDDVARKLNIPLNICFAPSAQIESLVGRAFQEKSTSTANVADELEQIEDVDIHSLNVPRSEDLIDNLNKAPLIKMVNAIFARALKERASDVHIHPYEDVLKIRHRIDGVLYDMLDLPIQFTESVISRIKVISGLDIAERRAPQDGRTTLRFADREVDVRVSVVPTSNGERAVLRLLNKGAEFYELEEIGMQEDVYSLYVDRLIRYSHGILFVTGPTGSGKTTTLYAALSRINSSEKNIITIEDPIEYQLEGISQIQVNMKKGVTFATGLRSVLRQDPDILMVGEVRDYDTAGMAIQSALTGHLVFSTLHTNDAPSAITRLLDMGVEPYLIASSVIAVMGQRLVRKICPFCKEAYEPEDKILKDINIERSRLKDGVVHRGKGCSQCRQTGYKGRTGIFELFVLTPHVKDQIMNRDNATRIKRDAVGRDQNMRTMHADGIDKIIEGTTTIEEVMAHTRLEEL